LARHNQDDRNHYGNKCLDLASPHGQSLLSTFCEDDEKLEATVTKSLEQWKILTFMATLSHLRQLNTPIGCESKLAEPRQLHNTHWGMVCPAETPEGGMCGLVKNLALVTYVSVRTASNNRSNY
jgi:hypothetical protein